MIGDLGLDPRLEGKKTGQNKNTDIRLLGSAVSMLDVLQLTTVTKELSPPQLQLWANYGREGLCS